jgi:nitroreductase
MKNKNNLDFINLLKNRYSVRKFSTKEVEEDKIKLILEAGRLAPTACNYQPFKIYILKSKEALEKLQKCKYSYFGETLAFLICSDKEKCWKRQFDNKLSGEIDAAIVTTHMMLEVANLGLGSTWIMHFIPEALIKEFNLPTNLEPVSLLVVGYPAIDAQPSIRHNQRKDISELVEYL